MPTVVGDWLRIATMHDRSDTTGVASQAAFYKDCTSCYAKSLAFQRQNLLPICSLDMPGMCVWGGALSEDPHVIF